MTPGPVLSRTCRALRLFFRRYTIQVTTAAIKTTPMMGAPITARYRSEFHPRTPLLSPLWWSYAPGGITCPGTHCERYFPDVRGGNDGDMVLVSESAHETCQARWTRSPPVKVPVSCVRDARAAVMVASPGVIVRPHAGLSASVGRECLPTPKEKPLDTHLVS